MKIKVQDYNDVTVLELQGELDGDFTELFKNTITGYRAKLDAQDLLSDGSCSKTG